jgi:Rrf2 family nitric oxide-sensitive transcriptional repressor
MYLATHEGAGTVASIAEAYGISRNHLVKVVHQLGKAGYIHTTKGRTGGITLARPAAKIRVGDVVRDMEPNLALVECFTDHGKCAINPVCRLKKALGDANRAFMNVLNEYTLADVTSNPKQLVQILDRASN